MKNKTWNKTRVQGLLRHRSGTYYARLYINGKEKWLSLDTTVLEVAKAKLDKEKEAMAEARRDGWKPKNGKILMKEALDAYRERLKLRVSIKESTRKFYQWSLKAIVASWSELPSRDVRSVDDLECQAWAKSFATKYSPSYYNNAVLVLNEVFQGAIKAGVIWRNPAADLEWNNQAAKVLVVPGREEFHRLVAVVRGGRHRTAKHAADLIEFLAYTGCRISEARRVQWKDFDWKEETLTVKGDPDTATKNWKIRVIPLLAEAKTLLEAIRSQRLSAAPADLVFRIRDARGAFARAAKEKGIGHYSHHSMRHLFATTCIEAKVDIVLISKWLGHSDGGVLAIQTYAHLRDEHSKQSAKLVSFAVPSTK